MWPGLRCYVEDCEIGWHVCLYDVFLIEMVCLERTGNVKREREGMTRSKEPGPD